MPIALFADIHANREALAACLAHAQRAGADRCVFLGDLVGYGADPAWVVSAVMSQAERGALSVLGNHDAAVAEGADERMRAGARAAVEWTRAQLDRGHLEFLAGMPLRIDEEDRLYVHANAWSPGGWEYVAGTPEARRSMLATSRRITFCGHIHEPALYHLDARRRASQFIPVPGTPIRLLSRRRWLAIVGTVGHPRDGLRAARYAVFDERKAELTCFHVPYDYEAAAEKIRKAGLPLTPLTELAKD
ncbi:MAG TPA: metallophosphoesterase family protein [Burkholderiales bacterium]|nr:metallophosphoesterase family protein [Burkholderiales bacterium]